jgi:hypothetical protein
VRGDAENPKIMQRTLDFAVKVDNNLVQLAMLANPNITSSADDVHVFIEDDK